MGVCDLEKKRFKPLVDKSFWITLLILSVFLAFGTVVAIFELSALLLMLFVDVFSFYLLLSPLFGYAELRENDVFIKFGVFLKKEIPYDKIRGLSKERKFYSDSMLSLKTAMEHVNIKYNRFDVVSVSLTDIDGFISELDLRLENY